MRVHCRLREIREAMPRTPDGKKVSLRDIQERCQVSPGVLSMIEQGKSFPTDRQRPALEEAYGATVDTWYPATLLVELQRDPEDD